LLGRVGAVRTLDVAPSLVSHLDLSLAPVTPAPRERHTLDVSDLCPDPLVFAVNQGLPRLRLFDEQIDGGSEFVTDEPATEGQVTLVPRISDIQERYSSNGRRMMKTVYETRVYTSAGYHVGVVRGISLDIEKAGAS
jgi:hypothetical protein